MRKEDKTKEQLIDGLRRRIADLEAAEVERRRAEKALQESEDRYRKITEAVTDYIFTVRIKDGQPVETIHGPASVAVIGYTPEEFAANPHLWIQMVHEEDRDAVIEQSLRILSGKVTSPLEHRIMDKSGETRWVRNALVPHYNSLGELTSYDGLISDITERKQAEEALAEEKERLATTLRSIGDGVIVTDIEGKTVLINKVAEILTGWIEEEVIDKPLGEVFHIINEDTRERCENPAEKILETGGIVGLANRTVLIARDGTERIIADSGAPIRGRNSKTIGVVVVFRDITEKRRMEQELSRIEKLESIGTLAGGIAHDFNNVLTVILGNISLAMMYLETGRAADKIIERLTEAERASMLAKDLTQQLLTFSRGGAPIKKIAFIAELLKDSVIFALRGSNVRCEFSMPDDLWPAEIDEGQINQVINNLIINADQAMASGGIVKVRAENMTVKAEHGLPVKDGEYVKISIEDRGIGIPEDDLPKIFDPYFTTKQKGSGLGLSTSYSIIKNHDGHITAESQVGVGTTFHIYLPASPEEILVVEKKVEGKPIMGEGRILVMDDEKHVRDLAAEMLSSIGYKVTTAIDGTEAIEMYKEAMESGNPFDAVIIDLTIPGGMGGKETIQKLIEVDPQVKAIVSSGYSNDPILANFGEYGFKGVVAKPYKTSELSAVLHRVIMGIQNSP